MTNINTFRVTSRAACPQLLYEVELGAQEHFTRHLQASRAVDILTMSDDPKLSVYLSRLFQKTGWTVAHAGTCQEGVSFLKDNQAAVAVCEERLPDGFWHEAAAALGCMPEAPALVVIGRDQSLVHDVVALGGFDVLVRPLREPDVVWTIASAWHAWMKRFEPSDTGVP